MKLIKQCRVICAKVAKKLGVPPFVVFQDPSLEDMAQNIHFRWYSKRSRCWRRKAKKYGKEFIELINRYVADNDII
jgi:ATP-dependent DNA helicase RecQ